MTFQKDKFWAFIALLICVLIIAAISLFIDAVTKDGQRTDPATLSAKLTILNIAMGGLIGAVGAASQSLFRSSATDMDNAKATRDTAAAARTTAETAKTVADSAAAAAINSNGNGNGSHGVGDAEPTTTVNLGSGESAEINAPPKERGA
jgi:hypothetical protein